MAIQSNFSSTFIYDFKILTFLSFFTFTKSEDMHLLGPHRKLFFWRRHDLQFTWQDNSRNQATIIWQLVKSKKGKKGGGRNNAPLVCNDIMAAFNWPFVQRCVELRATIKLSPIYTCQHSSDGGAHFCQLIGRGLWSIASGMVLDVEYWISNFKYFRVWCDLWQWQAKFVLPFSLCKIPPCFVFSGLSKKVSSFGTFLK